MFNFNNLTCVIRDSYSFVGVAKEGEYIQLYLPLGFQDQLDEIDTFENKRDLFFLLYRVLRQFKSICMQKGYLESSSKLIARDRDGVVQGDSGSTTTCSLEEPIIFYAKLDSIAALLDAYDDLKIAALTYRLGRTDRIDLSQLHRYLNRGVFSPNGAVYIDSMVLPRQQVQFETTDIIALYCYLVKEVKVQLGDEIKPEVSALAERFQQHYLGVEDSLFAEQGFERLIDTLKDALETIDQRTPIKDADYDQFYEAIEQFLYGNWQHADDGEILGLSNFHSVWESICLSYIAQTVPAQSLLFLDRSFVSDNILQVLDATPKLINLSSTFVCNGKNLIPDVVLLPYFTISKSVDTSYHLFPSDWNDYSYLTRLSCSNSMGFSRSICIAYIEQPIGHHTIKELQPVSKKSGGSCVIKSPLAEHFHSYWSFDWATNYQDAALLAENWQAMQYFNHIFCVAVRQGFWTFEAFQQYVLPELGVSKDLSGSNVFAISMFRGVNLNEIENEFNSFISAILQFCVVDVKYLSLDYLRNKGNIANIKERSIRKQFVYEYLLQQRISKLSSDADCQINSYFWIPGINSDQVILEDNEVYADGYLNLITVDMPIILDHYIRS
jgi:hypothetical protein